MTGSIATAKRAWSFFGIGHLAAFSAVVAVVLAASSCNRSADASSNAIRVNQVGFTPSSQMLAVVPESAASHFEIRTIDGTPVFSAELGESAVWPYSGEQVRIRSSHPRVSRVSCWAGGH